MGLSVLLLSSASRLAVAGASLILLPAAVGLACWLAVVCWSAVVLGCASVLLAAGRCGCGRFISVSSVGGWACFLVTVVLCGAAVCHVVK